LTVPQLTTEDRTFLIGHLTRTRNLLLSEISGLSHDQWIFHPDAETWSIADCADHIATIEKRIFSMVSKHMQAAEPNPQRASEVQKKTSWILEAVPSRHERAKVPASIENTSHSATPQEFAELFQERRATLLKYVTETDHLMHDRVLPHMIFKDLDGYQWLLMISLHSERHAAQIAEIKTHPNYPK
jgi:hypothetical protein